jgi:hypothetical protein
MDPDGIKAVGAYLTFYAGVIGVALAWEVIRVALFGVMLMIVLRRRKG